MKYIILILTATFLFISCNDDIPANKSDDLIQSEYTLEELVNDPDWVEVTDIDTVSTYPCISVALENEGIHLNSKTKFDSLVTLTNSLYNEQVNYDSCFTDYNELDFDSKSKDLILFSTGTNLGPRVLRKVFKHRTISIFIYYNELEIVDGNEVGAIYYDLIAVPKVNDVKFIINRINF